MITAMTTTSSSVTASSILYAYTLTATRFVNLFDGHRQKINQQYPAFQSPSVATCI